MDDSIQLRKFHIVLQDMNEGRTLCPLCNTEIGLVLPSVIWYCPLCREKTPPYIHFDCLEKHCTKNNSCPVCEDASLGTRGAWRLAFAGIRRALITVAISAAVFYTRWRFLSVAAFVVHSGLDGRRIVARIPKTVVLVALMVPMLMATMIGLFPGTLAFSLVTLIIDGYILVEFITMRFFRQRGTVFTRPVWWMAFGRIIE